MVAAAGLGWWRAQDVLVRDAAFAVGVVALTLVPGTGQLGAAIGDLPVRQLDGWGVVLVGLLSVPLVLRRRYPGWCLALVGGGFAGYELVCSVAVSPIPTAGPLFSLLYPAATIIP